MKKITTAATVFAVIGLTSCYKNDPLYPPPPPQNPTAVVIVKNDPAYGDQTVTGSKSSFLIGDWTVEVKNEPVQFIGTTFSLDTLSSVTLAKVKKLSSTIKGIGIDRGTDTLQTLQTRENDFYVPQNMNIMLGVNDSYRIKLYADVAPPVKFTSRMKFWYVNGRGELNAVSFKTGQTITIN